MMGNNNHHVPFSCANCDYKGAAFLEMNDIDDINILGGRLIVGKCRCGGALIVPTGTYKRDAVWLSEDDKRDLEIRDIARKNKNYAESDRIRNEFMKRGIVLKDTMAGTKCIR